jgi:hypothetical protein
MTDPSKTSISLHDSFEIYKAVLNFFPSDMAAMVWKYTQSERLSWVCKWDGEPIVHLLHLGMIVRWPKEVEFSAALLAN